MKMIVDMLLKYLNNVKENINKISRKKSRRKSKLWRILENNTENRSSKLVIVMKDEAERYMEEQTQMARTVSRKY